MLIVEEYDFNTTAESSNLYDAKKQAVEKMNEKEQGYKHYNVYRDGKIIKKFASPPQANKDEESLRNYIIDKICLDDDFIIL